MLTTYIPGNTGGYKYTVCYLLLTHTGIHYDVLHTFPQMHYVCYTKKNNNKVSKLCMLFPVVAVVHASPFFICAYT